MISNIAVGLGAFIYHERYSNKPRTLDEDSRYANSDSGGCTTTSVDDASVGTRISHIDCSAFDLAATSRVSLRVIMT